MPAPHTAAAVAEQPAASSSLHAAKLQLPSDEAAGVLPPAAPASPPTSTPSPAAPFVSAAALEAIADVESTGEASGDAEAVAELVACLEAKTRKVSVEEKKERRRESAKQKFRNPDLNTSFLFSLCPTQHQTIPCSFLYDGPGSALYDAITDLEAYYPYNAELELLNSQSNAIAAAIPENAVLVELGCGSATKTPRLLSAVARRNKSKNGGPVRYAGIDVSADFLENARANVTAAGDVSDSDVETFCHRYLEGAAAARAAHRGEDLCFLWLGSSVGNLDSASAAAFVRELFAAAAAPASPRASGEDGGGAGEKGGKTQLLLCTDLWKDEARLRAAYDDDRGVTAAFMRNGLRHALACVEVLRSKEGPTPMAPAPAPATTALRAAAAAGAAPALWRYEVDVNARDEQVEMYLVCPAAFELRVPGRGGEGSEGGEASVVRFEEGERVLMEISRKYTLGRIESLAASSGVRLTGRWVTGDYGIQLLE